MRLFWKEQVPLILFFSVQVLLVPLLYALTGEHRPMSIILYGILISLTVLVLYLGYRYATHRLMYKELSAAENVIDYNHTSLGQSPLSQAVYERMRQFDSLYREQLHQHQVHKEQHTAFVNRWVHQMKTPLSVIQLTLPELDDVVADHLQEEVERLRNGLEMVLYTARLERFEQDFTVEPVWLKSAVSEAIARNRKLFIRKSIVPDFQIEETLRIYTDVKWFHFIMDQLLINAVNYSGAAGKKVTLKAESSEDKVILHIVDEGIGIAKEDIGRVFHPYFTGDRGRQYHESTGMGLYLVREISQKLGHRVEITSQLGEGTILTLMFRKVPMESESN
ncbi:sensor histidine kinase [Paenibacillus alba]|nr:sensor histidine kinase [Paenibacillus alba]NQX65185.1 sensor histidine kinase [Paenibacillus alba]